jgi:hypothetical protein
MQYQRLSDFKQLYTKKTAHNYSQLFGHQLRQIHGCSPSVATAMMTRFGTTVGLFRYLEQTPRSAAEVGNVKTERRMQSYGVFLTVL